MKIQLQDKLNLLASEEKDIDIFKTSMSIYENSLLK